MKGNVSKLVRNALLRSLPLRIRATWAQSRLRKANAFADWICPEMTPVANPYTGMAMGNLTPTETKGDTDDRT